MNKKSFTPLETFEYIWKNNGCHGVISCDECIFRKHRITVDMNDCTLDYYAYDVDGKIYPPYPGIRNNIKEQLPRLIKEKKITKEDAIIAIL